MAKSKKKEKNIFLWTEKATKLFGSKSIVPGEPAQFMGRLVTEENVIASWLDKGYIVAAKKEGEQDG